METLRKWEGNNTRDGKVIIRKLQFNNLHLGHFSEHLKINTKNLVKSLKKKIGNKILVKSLKNER